MSNKKYFEIISAKAGFVVKYARAFRLLAIIIYLVCLEMLVVDVLAAVDYVPGPEEVRARFSPIKSRTEIINSIESYFLNKETNLISNLQKGIINNPFVSHKAEMLNPVLSPSPSPNPSLSPSPSPNPSAMDGLNFPESASISENSAIN